jgi:hypothetical protein
MKKTQQNTQLTPHRLVSMVLLLLLLLLNWLNTAIAIVAFCGACCHCFLKMFRAWLWVRRYWRQRHQLADTTKNGVASA